MPVPRQIMNGGLAFESGVSRRIEIRGPVPGDLELAGGILVFADESKGALDQGTRGDDAPRDRVVDANIEDRVMVGVRGVGRVVHRGRLHGCESSEDEGDAREYR